MMAINIMVPPIIIEGGPYAGVWAGEWRFCCHNLFCHSYPLYESRDIEEDKKDNGGEERSE